MFADYGHVSKNFDLVFVGAHSPDVVLVHGDLHLKKSHTHFISLINFNIQ